MSQIDWEDPYTYISERLTRFRNRNAVAMLRGGATVREVARRFQMTDEAVRMLQGVFCRKKKEEEKIMEEKILRLVKTAFELEGAVADYLVTDDGIRVKSVTEDPFDPEDLIAEMKELKTFLKGAKKP